MNIGILNRGIEEQVNIEQRNRRILNRRILNRGTEEQRNIEQKNR
jgi:hypothetical protein